MRGSRPLADDEIRIISDSFTGRYMKRNKALFILGLKSGFRVSELLSLRIGDVQGGGRIFDRVTVERKNVKKKTEGRTVLLNPTAKAALADWIEEMKTVAHHTDGAFLFQSREGLNKPVSRVQAWRILNKAFQENDLQGKLGTHTMRKTFASKMYDALDRDLVRLQAALGHRNINSTVQYLSFSESDIDAAIMTI